MNLFDLADRLRDEPMMYGVNTADIEGLESLAQQLAHLVGLVEGLRSFQYDALDDRALSPSPPWADWDAETERLLAPIKAAIAPHHK
jgi:hypothetical protein